MIEILVPSAIVGAEPADEAHVVVAHVDVDEAAERPGVVQHPGSDPGWFASSESRTSARVDPSADTSPEPPV